MISPRPAWVATLVAALLSGAEVPEAGAGGQALVAPLLDGTAQPASPKAPVAEPSAPSKACADFAASGQAAALMAIARRIYRDAAGLPPQTPVDMPERSGRPAGPRDEPPPPEWPEGPSGLVLCLKVKGRVLGCEGGSRPASTDLVAAISALAERLPSGESRGRSKTLRARDLPVAALEAAFISHVEPVIEAAGKRTLPAGIDPAAVGFVVSGEGREVVTFPGEARSIRSALRFGRKAGLKSLGAPDPSIGVYSPIPIGSVPIVTP
jgi:hypothetical protein